MNRKEICNSLCELLVSKFTGETSLQVIDCHTFFIFKGITNNEVFLDISPFLDSFKEKYELKKFSYFDLIEYSKDSISEKTKEDYIFSISSDIISN